MSFFANSPSPARLLKAALTGALVLAGATSASAQTAAKAEARNELRSNGLPSGGAVGAHAGGSIAVSPGGAPAGTRGTGASAPLVVLLESSFGQTYSSAFTVASATDAGAPAVLRINTDDRPLTNRNSVVFTVEFTEVVARFTAADMSLTATGITGASITSVTPVGPSKIYQVTVNTGTGDGTLVAKFNDRDTVIDDFGNPVGGLGTGLQGAPSGTYTIDKTPPTLTLTSALPQTTNVRPMAITVGFSEPVKFTPNSQLPNEDLAMGDFTLAGLTAQSLVATGSPAANTFRDGTLTVNPSTEGPVTVQLTAGKVQDLAGNSNTASATFSRTFDGLPPILTIRRRTGTFEYSNLNPLPLILEVSEENLAVPAVNKFTVTNGSIAPAGFTVTTAPAGTPPGSKSVFYNFGVIPAAQGRVTIAIAAATLTDAGGNASEPGSFNDVIYDSVRPAVAITRADPNPTAANTVRFTITFAEPTTDQTGAETFSLADLSVAATPVLTGTPVISLVKSATPPNTWLSTVEIPADNQNSQVALRIGTAVMDRATNGFLGATGPAYDVNNHYNMTDLTKVGDGTSSGGLTMTGPAGSQLGFAVSGVGDINDDGREDVGFTAPAATTINGQESGEGYVVLGSSTRAVTQNLALADVLRLRGGRVSHRLGQTISGAGNVNGVGPSELLIGAPLAAGNSESFLLHGSRSFAAGNTFDFKNTGGRTQLRKTGGLEVGASLSGVGSVNADNFSDYVIGIPGTNGGVGEAYLLYGTSTLPVSADVSTLTSSEAVRLLGANVSGWRNGATVAGLGDVNGDGIADFLVGADPTESIGTANDAVAYVVYGRVGAIGTGGTLDLTTMAATVGSRIKGPRATKPGSMGTHPGALATGIGDFNGDGFSDLAIGLPAADIDQDTDAGRVFVVLGSPQGLGASGELDLALLGRDANGDLRPDGFEIRRTSASFDDQSRNAFLGLSVSSAGDFNADGFADLAIGAWGEFLKGGATYVVFGASAIPAAVDNTTPILSLSRPNGRWWGFNSLTPEQRSGWSVALAGDVNRDGVSDIAIGSPGSGDVVPKAQVVYGRAKNADGGTYIAYIRSGEVGNASASQTTPPEGIGSVGDGSQAFPMSRLTMSFTGGGASANKDLASRQEVTLIRRAVPTPTLLADRVPAPVQWRVVTNRETLLPQGAESNFTFQFLDSEVAGFDLGRTQVYYTSDLDPTAGSCWIPISDLANGANNTFAVTRRHKAGTMAIQLNGTYAVMFWNAEVDLGREIVSPFAAGCSPGDLWADSGLRMLDLGPTSTPSTATYYHPASKRLYSIQPTANSTVRIEWKDQDTRIISTHFARTRLPVVDSEYQMHVAGSDVPPVDLTVGGRYQNAELLYATPGFGVSAALIGTAREFSSSNAGSALIVLVQGQNKTADPISFLRVKSKDWNAAGFLIDSVPAEIGKEVPAVLGAPHDKELGAQWAYFPLSSYNSRQGYYSRRNDQGEVVRTGPIIPVNEDLPSDYANDATDDLVVLPYQRSRVILDGNPLGAAFDRQPQTFYANNALTLVAKAGWPYRSIRYIPSWPTPTTQSTIVIASGLGTGPLDFLGGSVELYYQNDRTKPGFNPNDEHSLIMSNVLYSLRMDLNNTATTSKAWALVGYTDLEGPKMRAWRVLAETPQFPFRYSGTVGAKVMPPLPLSVRGVCGESNPVTTPFLWEDRNGEIWAAAGNDNGVDSADTRVKFFYKWEDGFFDPNYGTQPSAGTCVPWLDRYAQTVGVPLQLTYTIKWPTGDIPLLDIGETAYKTSTGGIAVTDNCSVDVIYQQSKRVANGQDSVLLWDPITETTVAYDKAKVITSNPPLEYETLGNRLEFPGLPPHLKSRFYLDQDRNKLVFVGKFRQVTGEPQILPNRMTPRDLELIKGLQNAPTDFKTAADKLYTDSRVYKPAQPGPDSPKAFTALDFNRTGWVVWAAQNAGDCEPLPVSVRYFKVRPKLYTGDLKPMYADCAFDEKLTVAHNADFAGDPQKLRFQWYYAPDDGGVPPAKLPGQTGNLWTEIAGVNLPTFAITPNGTGGLGPLFLLTDNWFVVRYSLVDDPTKISDFTTPQLAEGWVKRVLNAITPFEQRFTDYRANSVNTIVSMIQQAGPPRLADVPLNCGGGLDSKGLIEIYETVLGRGRDLSIDAIPNTDYPPANNALLLAQGRIADLYTLLGNEAYADAINPTIGFGTDNATYGSKATSIHAFMNQTATILEEELDLLRGRDASKAPATTIFPLYNRLPWNFTNDITGGEVAYALNYGIRDVSGPDGVADGVIGPEDGIKMYPHGHGDAWGHYLTSMKGYYKLLRSNAFTWVPRAEAVVVAGLPVTVDYYDERKFALIAAQKARTGRDIVNLTYRDRYVEDPRGQWQGYRDSDTNRAWGFDEWATRAGQSAYLDWVTGNAILPDVDVNPSHTGIQKVDRTTVLDLNSVATAFSEIQREVDQANIGLNPLGVARNVLPFDISPTELDSGVSHFKQIYGRAVKALRNAAVTFNSAAESSTQLRAQADSVARFQTTVDEKLRDYDTRLVAIFGQPYPEDVGIGKHYPPGYSGPDIDHWYYTDPSSFGELNGKTVRTQEFTVKYDVKEVASYGDTRISNVNINYVVDTDTGRLVKPAGFTKRPYYGQLHEANKQVADSLLRLKQGIQQFRGMISSVEDETNQLEQSTGLAASKITIRQASYLSRLSLDGQIQVFNTVADFLDLAGDNMKELGNATATTVPTTQVFGLANGGDFLAPLKGALQVAGTQTMMGLKTSALAQKRTAAALELAKDAVAHVGDTIIEAQETSLDLSTKAAALRASVRAAQLKQLELYSLADAVEAAITKRQNILADGASLIENQTAFKMQTGAAIQAYRYRDMAFRIFRDGDLARYRAQFDLAQRYVYLAARVYDYETGLLSGSSDVSGDRFLTEIIRSRGIGTMSNPTSANPIPQTGTGTGDPGLADALARMSANWDVLEGQLGFNNPTAELNSFSLRRELFRIPKPGDAGYNASVHEPLWQQVLDQAKVDNILNLPSFRRYALPFEPAQAAEPGFVFRFQTSIASGMNYFQLELGSGDSAFDSTAFATKIRSLGLTFENYDRTGLSLTPRIYLFPVGEDIMRSPARAGRPTAVRDWTILDQVLPVPIDLTAAAYRNNPAYIPEINSLNGSFVELRKFGLMRAFSDNGFTSSNLTTSSRLVGRSVWNSEWQIIIPASQLLGNRSSAMTRFVRGSGGTGGVTDIRLHYKTYAHTGNLGKK